MLRHLYDPRRGDPALQIEQLRWKREPIEPERTNQFSVYWLEAGAGRVSVDTAQFDFQPRSLLFFLPYQYLRFEPTRAMRGERILFHANFLCVETFHAETGCSGVLFNDPYGGPTVPLDEATQAEVVHLVERLHQEQAAAALAATDVMLSYMKVLLVLATRQKLRHSELLARPGANPRHTVIQQLKDLIERHYCTHHAPADYAAMLHMTPKTLGRLVREQTGGTLSNLIRGRILTHAKWQMLHTLRPVKEIARELGFADELYFSRLFKKATGVSPTFFREFETEIRGGSNLSMVSS